MTQYDAIVESTRADHERAVNGNPLFRILQDGFMSRAHYVAYLRETYHLVRHTSRALSLAGACLRDDRRDLRDWFFEQAQEENGHDLFCVKDLKNLGEDPEKVLRGSPQLGAWGLVAQNYYMATYGNPVGILGVASTTEGLGATVAGEIADLLVKKYAVPSNAVTFLRSHSGFDEKHLEDAKRAINEMVKSDEEIDLIIHARRATYFFYSQLFWDVARADPNVQPEDFC